jgi:hypothetical protein
LPLPLGPRNVKNAPRAISRLIPTHRLDVAEALDDRNQSDFGLAPLDHDVRSDLGDPEEAEVVDPQPLARQHHGG